MPLKSLEAVRNICFNSLSPKNVSLALTQFGNDLKVSWASKTGIVTFHIFCQKTFSKTNHNFLLHLLRLLQQLLNWLQSLLTLSPRRLQLTKCLLKWIEARGPTKNETTFLASSPSPSPLSAVYATPPPVPSLNSL